MSLHKFGGTELLGALYTRLTTDALTSGYSTYQVGSVPVDPVPSFPYVTIGGIIGGKSAQFTSRDIKGEEIVIHCHIWSAAESDVECSDMMDNVTRAVTTTDLALTGYTTLILIPDYSQIMIDDTNAGQILRHGVLRFRAQIA